MPEPKTILCFGDSNTHGTMPMASFSDRDRYARSERWPGVMASALGPDVHVVEEGLPGRTTVHADPLEGAHMNGLAMLPAVLRSHQPIDAVIVMLGTNDLKARFSVTPFDIALGAANIVDLICASASGPAGRPPGVLLISPPPIIETGILAAMFEGGEAKSHRLAAAYRKVACDRGIAFLDAGEHIRSAPEEGIHLEAESHTRLGRVIADAILAVIR